MACRIFFLIPATLSKKRLRHRCFPENFEKRLRTIFYRTLPDDYFWCLWPFFNFDFIKSLLVYRLIKWFFFESQKFYNLLKKPPFASSFYSTLLCSFSFFIITEILLVVLAVCIIFTRNGNYAITVTTYLLALRTLKMWIWWKMLWIQVSSRKISFYHYKMRWVSLLYVKFGKDDCFNIWYEKAKNSFLSVEIFNKDFPVIRKATKLLGKNLL